MRISVSPENAVRLESEMHRIDVRHLAPRVQAPTLIFHSREDEAVPFEEGRRLASLIPNAQFVPLESKNHLLTEHEPAWKKFLAALRGFLAGDDG
jgi:pimeloyl-ACP methyl ester carboxylesterase